jgi:methyl-accepting chemotaxis protein
VRITPLLEEVQADSGHNARRVEQVSEATTALDEMVRELRESMSRFRIEAKAA